MKTLDEIKKMMAAGDTVQADAALKDLLAKEPDNLQAKMLYGTCRQLLGDEETFRRIHDGLTPEMERLEKKEPKAETVSLWKKYHALWMTLIIAGLILAGTVGAVYYYGKNIMAQYEAATTALYAGSGNYQMQQLRQNSESLYAGPPKEKRFIKTSDEDVDVAK